MLPSLDKILEAKRSSVQISKKVQNGRCFIAEKFQVTNIGEAVKLYQYFQNLF